MYEYDDTTHMYYFNFWVIMQLQSLLFNNVSEIINSGNSKTIALGVVHKAYDLDSMPGCGQGSVAYHADDGG